MNVLITPLRRFFNLLKVDKKDIFSIYLYALFNGVLALTIPLGIQAIISFITAGQVSSSWILLVIIVVIGIALSGVMQIMQVTITENLQQKIFTRSAFEFAYRIPRIKNEALEGAYMPELTNRFFDTLTIQKGLPKILMDFSSAALQIFFGVILLSLYHPFFIMFSFALLLFIYLIFRFTTPKGLRTSIKESTYKYEVAHWLEEIARSRSTFKLAGSTPMPLAKTDEKVQNYLSSRKAHFKTLLFQFMNLVTFKILIASGLLIVGGLLVMNQEMNIGQFVAAEIIIILILASVEKLILSIETIYDVLTAIEKVGSVTDLELESDQEEPVSASWNSGIALNISELSYQFPNAAQPTIKNISVDLPAGSKLCISGSHGSGKSLLLQLLSGLYDSYQGSISYNNNSLRNINKEALRDQIGDNLSREDIFMGSLLENITMGKPHIKQNDVHEVCSLLKLNDSTPALRDGLQTQLLPEGKNLPRSVRIKIMLARAIVGLPKLILLEDNLNELQVHERNRLIDYLLENGKDSTIITISNNPEIAAKFGRVLVIEHGEMLALGNMAELKKENWFKSVFQSA
ncbi:MAG: ATP-binding cassette domain-containing protein [Flavobacteriales bacterium]|nr:ATP-binding cassette domain-containing protein [Flavobacteriales bacterium]